MDSTARDALLRIEAGARTSTQETSRLDFKVQGKSIEDTLMFLAEACACFANAEGGSVVVGVADKASGSDAFVGTTLDPEKTRHRVHEVTHPPLTVDAELHPAPHGDVLVLTVPRGLQVHIVKNKAPTERIGTDCVPMTSERIMLVMSDKSGLDWSAEDTLLPVSAVTPLSLAAARTLLDRASDPFKRGLAKESDIDILRALGVVTPHQTLTNAGALLFTTFRPGVELISYTFRKTPAGALAASEYLQAPLVPALQRVFDLIQARTESTPVSVGKGQQLHINDLPEAAVREAVVNAAMHRDYATLDRITVEHAPTRLSVTSPGAFVPGVTVTNVLTTSSRARNKNLASAMRTLGFAETAGTGVDRMYAEMARIGHEPPRYEADQTSVRVTLLGGTPNAALARYVATLPADEADDADAMLTLLTLLTRKTVSAQSMAGLLQKPTIEEAQSSLARLADPSVGLLEPNRETARRAMPTYRLRETALVALGTAVQYRRRTTDQLDRKVIDFVRESGTINGRMVRILLDMDTVSASKVLGDLVNRGLLVKTSQATRGPGVTYGLGPRFPRAKGKKASERVEAEENVGEPKYVQPELSFDE
jgi:ATP-dependent DNA helicase RecG